MPSSMAPEDAPVLTGKNKNKKLKKEKNNVYFFSSSILYRIVFYGILPAVFCCIGIYVYLILSPQDDQAGLKGHSADLKAPPSLSSNFRISKKEIDTLDWSSEPEFIDGIIQRARPVLIRDSPVNYWDIVNWDFTKLSKTHMILNGSRFQSTPVFVLGHMQDKGGMLGKLDDSSVTYVDVYLKDFLHSVFDADNYLYWTGPSSVFEKPPVNLSVSSAGNKFGGWETLKVVEKNMNISRSDETLWMPMLWFSHPGVVAQTHYDTQHNFLAQILGKKKVLIFEEATELYPYPNIHLSHRQSQLHLESNLSVDSLQKKFSLGIDLKAYEFEINPGDLLYIPPYWSHRIESVTLALSVSVLSPSMAEAALADALWTPVPFGPFEGKDGLFRSGAVKLLMYYIVELADTFDGLTLENFSDGLYLSRYKILYPPETLESMKRKLQFRCPSTNDEELASILERMGDKIHDAAFAVTEIVNELKIHNKVKETFFRDYAEQVIRWAVGPQQTPLFIKFCLQ